MDRALHADFANFYTIWGSTTKISGLLQLRKRWVLTKFKGCGSKMGLPRPFEVLNVFGGKSKSKALNAFKFGPKRVPIEVNNWWKFGVDISNHFWDIQFGTFLFFKVPSLWYKIVFENYFYTTVRALWKKKMFKIEYLKSGLRYQHQIFTSSLWCI